MTDNTKLHPHLCYSANLRCIIGSTFLYDQTRIEYYDEVETIIRNIISNNAIAKQVCLYLLQIPLPKFPPIVIGLVPNNGSETSTYILQMHEMVLEIASQLSIHIIFIGANGASTEFNVQKYLITKNTGSIKAKVLSIVNCDNELFNFLNTFKEKSNQSDYENNKNVFFDDFNSLSQNNEISNSYAIAIVASTIADFNTIDIRNDDIENDLRDACLELAFLLLDASITEAGALDILYLVNLRKNHKCYSNQIMKRKTTYRIQNLDRMNSVSSNMISSLIADCTLNIDTFRTEKLRGIWWKNRCHLSVLSNTNKKLDLNGITIANIGEHNPLCKYSYRFAYINRELCLVQIVALYQKNSNYHSYVCSDVFSIDSLFYLSVKIFLPL
ncbi:17036_t:CDS:2 [Gigaspora margarita]|uniref:17036_t:CDS:1 n=1 Tax=Gigaspora margarita TaxID=4874 RepID=A0ABN7VG70_GIGMA|nr:17036_t:CDS:2 [Gigaspora margarita]